MTWKSAVITGLGSEERSYGARIGARTARYSGPPPQRGGAAFSRATRPAPQHRRAVTHSASPTGQRRTGAGPGGRPQGDREPPGGSHAAQTARQTRETVRKKERARRAAWPTGSLVLVAYINKGRERLHSGPFLGRPPYQPSAQRVGSSGCGMSGSSLKVMEASVQPPY